MPERAERLKRHTSQFRDTIFVTWTSTDLLASTVFADADILHAVDHSLGAAEQDDGKVLYLGADRAGNMLEVVSVTRDDDTEIVIHAMRMRRIYEPLLREMRGTDD